MAAEGRHDGPRRTLGFYLADDDPGRSNEDAYLVWFHGGADPVQLTLPGGDWGRTYTVLAHSGPEGELPADKLPAGAHLDLPGRTVVVLQVD